MCVCDGKKYDQHVPSTYTDVRFLSKDESSCLCYQSRKKLCLMFGLWLQATSRQHLLSSATLGRTYGEQWITVDCFKIEINLSARHKWEDNIIITPQASGLYFSICLLSFHLAVAIWWIVLVYVLVFVCACVCESEQVTQKIPLMVICTGLLCYSRLSGTLAMTYLNDSNQQKTNKICFYIYRPFSLFHMISSFTLHQSL